MTACLAICREGSRTVAAVDHSTESQVAASDSSAFPKAAPSGVSRASGSSKFFENVKPLSYYVGAVLDVAGSYIGNLLGFNKMFDLSNFFGCEISSTDQKKENFKSTEQDPALGESHSASQNKNVVLTPGAVQASFSVLENHSPSEATQEGCKAEVRNSQSRNLQEEWKVTLFDGPSDSDIEKFCERLTSSSLSPQEISTWSYV